MCWSMMVEERIVDPEVGQDGEGPPLMALVATLGNLTLSVMRKMARG